MNCEKAREYMSLYLDEQLDQISVMELENHLSQCEQCKEEFTALIDVIDAVSNLPQLELPDDYHGELMQKLSDIQRDEKPVEAVKTKKRFYQNWKVLSTAAAAILVVVVLANGMGTLATRNKSAGSAPSERYDTVGNDGGRAMGQTSDAADNSFTLGNIEKEAAMPQSEPNIEMAEAPQVTADRNAGMQFSAQLTGSKELQNRKIIQNAYISLEVEDFDGIVISLRTLVEQQGGYVENADSHIYSSNAERDQYLKEGTIVLKVPREQYGTAREQVFAMGRVIDQNERANDVTVQYVETESRIRMLQLQEERLLDIMRKADAVEDLIKLEERMNQVRTELEIYKGQIQNWDRLVQFSTISVTLREVRKDARIETVTPNFQTKLGQSFIRSINDIRQGLENLSISIAYRIIPFTLTIIGIGIVFLITRPFIIKWIRWYQKKRGE